MGEREAQNAEAADHLGSGEAREFLSRLSGAIGVGGVLMVQESAPGFEGADLAPGSALSWPRCECGSPRCPDYNDPPNRPPEGLSSNVAESDARSRGGGL